jgi:hypothetical protein
MCNLTTAKSLGGAGWGSLQRYATRGLDASTSLATRRMGAISTSDDGTTSLSKICSPRFTAVCVLRMRRCPGGCIGPPRDRVRDNDVIVIASSHHAQTLLLSGNNSIHQSITWKPCWGPSPCLPPRPPRLQNAKPQPTSRITPVSQTWRHFLAVAGASQRSFQKTPETFF